MTGFPFLMRSTTTSGQVRYRLGDPLVDRYLEFVAGRARPNTLRAVAFDLKMFFAVIAKDPREVTAVDVFDFLAHLRRVCRRRAARPAGRRRGAGRAARGRPGCRSSRARAPVAGTVDAPRSSARARAAGRGGTSRAVARPARHRAGCAGKCRAVEVDEVRRAQDHHTADGRRPRRELRVGRCGNGLGVPVAAVRRDQRDRPAAYGRRARRGQQPVVGGSQRAAMGRVEPARSHRRVDVIHERDAARRTGSRRRPHELAAPSYTPGTRVPQARQRPCPSSA
jgi:hypothetical protein